jgi:hypothetical protein
MSVCVVRACFADAQAKVANLASALSYADLGALDAPVWFRWLLGSGRLGAMVCVVGWEECVGMFLPSFLVGCGGAVGCI